MLAGGCQFFHYIHDLGIEEASNKIVHSERMLDTWLISVLCHESALCLVKHIASLQLLAARSRLRVALFGIGEGVCSSSLYMFFLSNSPNDQYSLHYITISLN